MRAIGKIFSIIPTLSVPLVYLNIRTRFMQPEAVKRWFDKVVMSHALPSGGLLQINVGTLFIIFGLFLLLIEIYKSTHVNNVQIVEHTMSFFLFVVYSLQLIFDPRLASSVFLLLGMMAAVDLIAGIAITITAARKDSVTTIKAAGLIPD